MLFLDELKDAIGEGERTAIEIAHACGHPLCVVFPSLLQLKKQGLVRHTHNANGSGHTTWQTL